MSSILPEVDKSKIDKGSISKTSSILYAAFIMVMVFTVCFMLLLMSGVFN